MISIEKATGNDFQVLADIGRRSFIESHGTSASENDINRYVDDTYNTDAIKAELHDPQNIYHIIFYKNQPAGYSKIILNAADANIQLKNVTKLERLYLLKEFYDLKLGYLLNSFNIEFSKKHNQAGMWLFVWKENQRAVGFYEKAGFKIIGSYEFKLTETHSNPNHQMVLIY